MWSDHMNEVLACRACLVTDVKLHNIHDNRLVEHYEVLVGIPVASSDVQPQYVCSFCQMLLIKFSKFRAQCRKAQEVFKDEMMQRKCITTQNICTIDRDYYQLTTNYVRTNTDIIEFIDNEQKLDNGVKQEDCINDYIDDDSALYLTDHKIKIELEVDEYVNKEEKDGDSELKQSIFVEDQNLCKRNKVKDIIVRKERNTKKVPRKKERIDNESLEESIPMFVENPKIVKRKKVIKKIGESENNKKVSVKRGKSDDEIKEFANSLDFDVEFLTKDEQLSEIEERRMSALNASVIIKCDLCGKNFKDHNTAATHQKNCHDPAIGHHICEICSCRFKSNNKLLNHLRMHRVKFCCKNCDLITKYKGLLITHYNWHQGKRQSCPYCERIFEKVTSYFSHIRLKHASELIWCNLCGESFIGEHGLNAHKKRAHKDIEKCEFKCKNCNTIFINKEAFRRHEDTNRCDLSSCIKCGESFVSEQLLKYHLVQHHTRENVPEVHNLECEGCKAKFQNAVALKRHSDVCFEGGFACVQCGASFTTSELLNEHMIDEHTLEHTFKCEECNKTFSNAFYFREHYSKMHLKSSNVFDKNLSGMFRRTRPDRERKDKVHRAPKTRKRAKKGEVDKSVRKWRVVGEEAVDVVMDEAGDAVMEEAGDAVMEEAGDVVMEKAALAAPVRMKSIVCEVCGKGFTDSGQFKYHQRIHSGEKPFKCTQCPKTFTLKVLLEKHIRVHTGERPYTCEHCNKAFKTKSALYRHNLVHSGLRRHVCQLCDKTFQTSSCVKLHIKTVHMKLPMPPRNRRRNRLKDE